VTVASASGEQMLSILQKQMLQSLYSHYKKTFNISLTLI